MPPIQPQPGIMDIDPYVGGGSRAEGAESPVKLSSNENPFGPSPRAIAALRSAASNMHRYPPTDHAALRRAIADVHALDPAQVICGVGSDEIIHLLCQAYVGAGDQVVHTEHGFSMYRISALAAGGEPIEVPETDRRVDVGEILDGCTERTRLVFIANPANPTGTMVSADEVARLAENLPEGALLVLDGAYADYVPGFDGGISLATRRTNVVVTRTLSKLYGLGGLRVGWAYGPRVVVDVLNRIRGPFNLSAPALAAAEAALRDTAYRDWCLSETIRLREWMQEELRDLGVPTDDSNGNFVLARFRDSAEAQACNAHLLSSGLIVRSVAGYNLPQCLRITIGDEVACTRVIAAVAEFLERGRA